MAKRNTGGKSMVAWEKELEERAAVAVNSLPPSGLGNFISTRGGTLSLNGNTFPDNKLQCVILQHVAENSLYEGKFDPDNPAVPICFAFSEPDARDPLRGMKPHADSVEPQSEACAGCPHNEWGSADVGRGKACKNIVRVALLSADALDSVDDLKESPLAMLKVPVTSVKGFTAHVRAIAEKFKRPPFGVVSEIQLVPDPKSQFRVSFSVSPNSLIKDPKIFEALMERVEQANKDLLQPYQAIEDDGGKGKKAGKKAGTSRVARKPGKAGTRKKTGRRV